jgi:hypothetical protein
MIGSPASYPSEYSAGRLGAAPQRDPRRSMRVLAAFQSTTTPTMLKMALFLVARLRRFLNGRVAAAIAQHEQEAVLFAQRKLAQRQLDRTRIYRGPIDQVLASVKARKRAA